VPRRSTYRVRVKRAVEVFVDVQAYTAAGAEIEAARVPGVLQVFAKSAVRDTQSDAVHQRGEDE
jgi:hypothetical protein